MIDKSLIDYSYILQQQDSNIDNTFLNLEEPIENNANSFTKDPETDFRIHSKQNLLNPNPSVRPFQECPVCLDILCEPVKCQHCGTHMCRQCSTKFPKGACYSEACEGFEPQVIDGTRMDILSTLKFKCRQLDIQQDKSTVDKNECCQVGQFDLQAHEDTCRLKLPIKCGTCQTDAEEEIHSQNSLECLNMQVNIMLKFILKTFNSIISNDKAECERVFNISKDLLECETKQCLSNLCLNESKNLLIRQSSKPAELVSQLSKVNLICHGNAQINKFKFTKVLDDAWDTQVRVNRELTKGVHLFEVKLEDLKFDDGGSIFVGFKRWEDVGTSQKPSDFVGYYFYSDINTCANWVEAKPWINDTISIEADLDKKETRYFKGDLCIGEGDLNKLGNGYVYAFVILLQWNGDQIVLKDQKVLES